MITDTKPIDTMQLIRKSFIVLLLLAVAEVPAQLRLPNLFGSHMVLQRQKPIPVWGWAASNEKITVSLSGPGKSQSRTVKAGKDGKWLLRLDPLEAGGPFQVKVKGKKDQLTLEDVWIGEVWICSGQSNMEWPVRASDQAEKEMAAGDYPMIRHIKVARQVSLKPEEDIPAAQWQVATPATVGDFTAVGYFFARDLFRTLNVPVGLINSSWGGTQVESWISREAMNSQEEFREVMARLPASVDDFNSGKKKVLDDLIIRQQGAFPGQEELKAWSASDFNHSAWKSMLLPDRFDRQELVLLDGAVWFRKEVSLPAGVEARPFEISAGPVDDFETVYVNGVKVGGSTSKSAAARVFAGAAGVLKPGRNVVVIRVEDAGGTGGFTGKPEQMWIRQAGFEQSLAGDWHYRVESSVDNRQFVGPNSMGTLLYNSMISPLIPVAFRGVIWYQGESNAGRAYQYRKSFPLMISDWRSRWKEDFPFLFVQLAAFNAANGDSEKGSTWSELREAQTMTLASLPNTGMAVTADIGESRDIHPRNKQDVGKRLSLSALKIAYGKDVEYSGPVYKAIQQTGNKLILSFDHVGSGLVAKDKYGYLKGFEVAGSDRKFHWAKAMIEGDKVIVWSDEVSHPEAVHYGWADDNGEVNLYNKEGLPAVPFRTDSWKGLTEENRFR